jgi:hypothetical protein
MRDRRAIAIGANSGQAVQPIQAGLNGPFAPLGALTTTLVVKRIARGSTVGASTQTGLEAMHLYIAGASRREIWPPPALDARRHAAAAGL